ncbi:Glyco hydro 18 domain containing protein, partial [Asbolus verrucosus]
KVLCYYESGAVDFFGPDVIDINICTHINYAFFGINEEDGSLRPDRDDGLLRQLSGLKSKNPNLKLVISVGGWGEDPTRFSHVAADAEKKAKMAESALWYLQTYNFDGIDIDWEYPGRRGGTPVDKENFIDMLKVLRNKFDENGGYFGTAPEKITLGLGFYGHSYTLADPNDHGIGAPTTGAGTENGNYNNVCTLSDDWTEVWDDEQEVPYKYSGDQWIGYDNPKSIGLKVQYAKSRNLGGVMMWAVDLDDGDGSCGAKNALLEAIKDNL